MLIASIGGVLGIAATLILHRLIVRGAGAGATVRLLDLSIDPVVLLQAALITLFSGVVFLTTVGLVVAPIAHRILHRFHVGDAEGGDRG